MDLDYARGYPTDEANYRQLISYFETVDEPTVVLFFGDHERAFPMNFTQVGLPTRTSSTWKPRLNFIKPPSSYGATTI